MGKIPFSLWCRKSPPPDIFFAQSGVLPAPCASSVVVEARYCLLCCRQSVCVSRPSVLLAWEGEVGRLRKMIPSLVWVQKKKRPHFLTVGGVEVSRVGLALHQNWRCAEIFASRNFPPPKLSPDQIPPSPLYATVPMEILPHGCTQWLKFLPREPKFIRTWPRAGEREFVLA